MKKIVLPSAMIGVVLLLFTVACSRTVADRDADEGRDPLVRKARAASDAGDIDEAIRLFLRAVEARPGMARPHLDLAVIYNDNKKDYLRAVYHYTRYIELRPDAEKRAMIEESIREAETAFAAGIAAEAVVDAKIRELERENARLRSELRDLQGRLADARPSVPPVTRTVKTVDTAPGEQAAEIKTPDREPTVKKEEPKRPEPKFEIYYVRPKDTLSTIAAAVYNDAGKWKRIYDANRDTIPDSDRLRVGQALIIPK